ncbi:hypothetical protein [Sphingomonas sp. RB1R13]|uniref:hypothetical protein n=1 Tax=Sphingomonas sp. RB1R13 TaxID=3096159 RepID=UPI002FCBF182
MREEKIFMSDQLESSGPGSFSRLQEILEDVATPVGTRLADALLCALAVDCRQSGDRSAFEKLESLSVDDMIDVALDFKWALQAEFEFTLPLGTKVKGSDPGSVQIGSELFVLDAGRDGLFPVKTTSRAAEGPNLALLRAEIERLTRRLACRRIGLPSSIYLVDSDSHQLQFPPLEQAAGVVLQRNARETGADRFCSANPAQIKAFAEDIVLDMRALWCKRGKVGKQVTLVRAAVESALIEASAPGSVRSIAIQMNDQRGQSSFVLSVEYEGTDQAMRDGILTSAVPPSHLPGRLPLYYRAAAAMRERDWLNSQGADGRIDEIALNILSAAPEGIMAVLEKLAKSHSTVLSVPVGRKQLSATLFWRFGCIRAHVWLAGELEISHETLFCEDCSLPESLLSQLAGRSVSSLIELPFECSCKIEAARIDSAQELRLDLAPLLYLVNLSSGKVWLEPEGP